MLVLYSQIMLYYLSSFKINPATVSKHPSISLMYPKERILISLWLKQLSILRPCSQQLPWYTYITKYVLLIEFTPFLYFEQNLTFRTILPISKPSQKNKQQKYWLQRWDCSRFECSMNEKSAHQIDQVYQTKNLLQEPNLTQYQFHPI